MPDDEDRRRDAAGAADPRVVVPDDIRELAADVEAYRRELRASRRRQRWSRWLSHPGLLPVTVLVGAMALAGIVATLLTVMAPQLNDTRVVPEHVAAAPVGAIGSRGGLLPDAVLDDTDGTQLRALDLRPALLAVLPAHCDCEPLLDELAGEAYALELPLDVIAPAGDAEAHGWASRLTAGRTRVLYDPDDVLTSAYGGSARGSVTAILLDRDGTIFSIQDGVTPGTVTNVRMQLQAMRFGRRVSG